MQTVEARRLTAYHESNRPYTLNPTNPKTVGACRCRSLVQTVEARRLTAYHESGHALVAMFTPGARPVHKATIVPRGHALGMVSMVPHQDEYSITKQQMVAGIDVCMGGRVAEELIFGADQVRCRHLRAFGRSLRV